MSIRTRTWKHPLKPTQRNASVTNASIVMLIALMHAGVACAMAGVLWIVQLVVYPAFALVRADDLPTHASAHAARITPVVGPLMMLEAAGFAGLLVMRAPLPTWLLVAGGVTLVVNWLSTFLWQVPLHGRLQRGDGNAIEPLVRSNWLRTIMWTVRGALGCWMIYVLSGNESGPTS